MRALEDMWTSRSERGTGGLGVLGVALILVPMLAGMAIGVAPASAASPALGEYTSRAAGQLSPYVLIDVNSRHRITMISLAHIRCMSRSGRLDMMIGIQQRGGSFSITRRSGIFHVKTGKMLLGRDERVRGHVTSPGTATGSARVISIPRLGARPCDSGWVRFRAAAMDPIEGMTFFPASTSLTLPATATEQIKIVNRSSAASKTNHVTLTMHAQADGDVTLSSAPVTTVSTGQGRCTTPQWRAADGFLSRIACDLGRLQPGHQTTITVNLTYSSVPSPCNGRIDLSIDATIDRATLNDSPAKPIENQESVFGFELLCPP
jgi:hypothetical protein